MILLLQTEAAKVELSLLHFPKDGTRTTEIMKSTSLILVSAEKTSLNIFTCQRNLPENLDVFSFSVGSLLTGAGSFY